MTTAPMDRQAMQVLLTNAKRACDAPQQLRQVAERTRALVLASRRAENDATSVHQLLAATADSKRDLVRQQIEATVDAALKAVFGADMHFRLNVDVKRGSVGVVPCIGYDDTPGGHADLRRWVGIGEVGGGVVDVVSFAMRVAVLCGMQHPTKRPVLVADEPFRHVSAQYLPAVAAMVRALADQTGLQLLLVTHEPEIADAAHRVWEVSKLGGGSSMATPVVIAGNP